MSDEFDFDELDDYESDFGDIDIAPADVDSRKPASPTKATAQAVSAAIAKGAIAAPSRIASVIATKTPETATAFRDITQIGADIKKVGDDLSKDLGPTIQEMKNVTRRLLPFTKSFVPAKLYDGLERKLAAKQDEHSRQLTAEEQKAEARQFTMTNAISSIFDKQVEQQSAQKSEERIDRYVDMKLSDARHLENVDLLAQVANASKFHHSFLQGTFQGYLKKDLELKYQHLFVAKDSLEILKTQANILANRLPEIVQNTALPEIQKLQRSESLKEAIRSKTTERVMSFGANIGTKLSANLKEKFAEPFKNILQDLAMGGEMLADQQEMMEDMPGAKPSAAAGVGGFAGGIAGKMLATKGGRALARKLTPFLSDTEDVMGGMKARMNLTFNTWAKENEDAGGWKGALAGILPTINQQVDLQENMEANALEPTVYDKATRLSIVEVIPGYLAKILHGVDKLSDPEAQELVYDFQNRTFLASEDFKASISDRFFGKKEERTRMAAETIGVARAQYAAQMDGEELDKFDDVIGDLQIVFQNLANKFKGISAKALAAYVLDGETSSFTTEAFSGIEDPKQVATVLYSMIFNSEGEVNEGALNILHGRIQNMAQQDEYKTLMRRYANDLGYASYMSDYMEDQYGSNKVRADVLRERQTDVDQEAFREQVSDISRRHYRDLHQRDVAKREMQDKDKTGLVESVGKRVSRVTSGQRDLSDAREDIDDVKPSYAKGSIKIEDDQVAEIHKDETVIPEKYAEEFRNKLHKAGDTVTSYFDKMSNKIKGIDKEQVVTSISPDIKNIHEAILNMTSVIQKQNEKIGELIPDTDDHLSVLEDISDTTMAIYDFLVDGQESDHEISGRRTKTKRKGKLSRIGGMFGTALDKVRTTTKTLATDAQDLVTNTAKNIGGLGSSAIGGLLELFGKGTGVGFDIFDRGVTSFGGLLDKIRSKGKQKGLDLIDGITDIYTKYSLDAGMPAISLKMFKAGLVVDINGKVIKRLKDIKGPLFHAETGELLLSWEEIKDGIYTKSGEQIDLLKEKARGLMGKAKGLYGAAKTGIKDIFSGMFGLSDKMMGLMDKGIGLATKTVKGAAESVGSFFGFNQKRKEDPEVITRWDTLIRLVRSIDQKIPDRTIEGDADNDGIREGSFEDQMQDKEERLEDKVQKRSLRDRLASLKGNDKVQGLLKKLGIGGGGAGLASLIPGMGGGDEEDEGGFVEDAASMAAGEVAGRNVGKAGRFAAKAGRGIGGALKTLGGGALKYGGKALGLATMIPGVAGTVAGGIGSALGGLGAGAIAAIGMIPVAGQITLAALAVGAVGYGIYKWVTAESKADKTFRLERMRIYGCVGEGQYDAIKDLEYVAHKVYVGDHEMGSEDFEDLTDDLGLDSDDPKQIEFIVGWFKNRFYPAYVQYENLITQLNKTPECVENDIELEHDDVSDLDDDPKGLQTIIEAYNANCSHITRDQQRWAPTAEAFRTAEGKKPAEDKDLKSADQQSKKHTDKPQPQDDKTKPSKTETKQQLDAKKELMAAHQAQFGYEQTEAEKQKAKADAVQEAIEQQANTVTDDGWGSKPSYTSPEIGDGAPFNGDYSALVERTKQWIKRHEGLSLKNYKDSLGKPTIGYGHLNVEGYPELTKPDADALFEYDFSKHYNEAASLPEWDHLDPVRRMALVDLVFNMGKRKFMGFKQTRKLLAQKDYHKAGMELLDSAYARQVKGRSTEVKDVLQSGDPRKIRGGSVTVIGGKPIRMKDIPLPSEMEKPDITIPESKSLLANRPDPSGKVVEAKSKVITTKNLEQTINAAEDISRNKQIEIAKAARRDEDTKVSREIVSDPEVTKINMSQERHLASIVGGIQELNKHLSKLPDNQSETNQHLRNLVDKDPVKVEQAIYNNNIAAAGQPTKHAKSTLNMSKTTHPGV